MHELMPYIAVVAKEAIVAVAAIVAVVVLLLVWLLNLVIGDWVKVHAKRTYCWLRTGHRWHDIGVVWHGAYRIRCKECGFAINVKRRT